MSPALKGSCSATLCIDQTRIPIDSFDGIEAVNQPYYFTLRLLAPQLVDGKAYIGKHCELIITPHLPDGNSPSPKERIISGIIEQHKAIDPHAHQTPLIELKLVSKLSNLQWSGQPTVFTRKTPYDIAKLFLKKHGYQAHQYQILHNKPLSSIEYPHWVQAEGESDLDFFHRVLCRDGISYFFDLENNQSGETFCFFETLSALPKAKVQLQLSHTKGLTGIKLSTLTNFSVEEKPRSFRITYSDFNPKDPSTPNIASAGNGKTPVTVWGAGAQSQAHLEKLANAHLEQLTMTRIQFHCIAYTPFVLPGHLVNLKGLSDWIEETQARIIRCEHYFKKGQYKNKLTLIPPRTMIRPPRIKRQAGQMVHTAMVHSDNDLPYLDKNGRYTFATHIHNPDQKKDVMQQAHRATPYTGKALHDAMGMHFPLKNQAEVLVMYLYNDFNQPFLQNSPANAVHHAPVTRDNSWQVLLKTAWGQFLEFSDKEGKNEITLANANGKNRLQLQDHTSNPGIVLESERGEIKLQSKNKQNLIAGEDFIGEARGNLNMTCERNLSFEAQNIHLQAERIQGKIAKHFNIESQENIETNTKQLQIKSQGDIEFLATGNGIQVQLENGDMIWEVDTLRIQSPKALYLTTDGAGIHLSNSGISINGQSINFQAANVATPEPVSTQAPAPPITPPGPSKWMKPPIVKKEIFNRARIIYPPKWKSMLHHVDELANLEVTIKGFNGQETGKITLVQAPKNTPYHHTPTFTELQNQPPKDEFEFSLADKTLYQTEKKEKDDPGNAVLTLTYPLNRLKESKEQPTAPHGLYYAFVSIEDVDANDYSQALLILSPATLRIIEDKGQDFQARNAILQLRRALPDAVKQHPQCPKILESRYHKSPSHFSHLPIGQKNEVRLKVDGLWQELLTDDYKKPYPVKNIKIKAQQDNDLTLPRLMPPVIFDLHQAQWIGNDIALEQENQQARAHLHDEEVQYFNDNGNNALVFIHGFNVDYGEFTPHIEFSQIRAPKYPVTGLANIPWLSHKTLPETLATVYRDAQSLHEQFPQFEKYLIQDFLDKKQIPINGTGVHEWITHLENTLNRAAGFDGQDYQNFTRCIFIAWPGNPQSASDYMDAVQESIRMGPIVAKVLTNIKKQCPNLKLHLMAHSQGNGVLVHALNQIGMTQPNLIEHAFFWQAAIPNDALSNKGHPGHSLSKQVLYQKQQQDPWFCPFAHKGAKQFTVLFSKNDNVLGRLLHEHEQPEGVKLKKVWFQKPLMDELLPALLIQVLQLESIYLVATWLEVPTTQLFKPEKLEQTWQIWRKKHPKFYCRSKKRWIDCHKKLTEQYAELRHYNLGEVFNDDLNERLSKGLQDVHQYIKEFNPGFDLSLLIVLVPGGSIFYQLADIIKLIDESWGKGTVAHTLDQIIRQFFNKNMILFTQILAFAHTALLSNGEHKKPAMGYEGPDIHDKFIKFLQDSGKLKIADTTEWIWAHSDMKEPSEDIEKEIYKHWIVNKIRGVKSFGKYDIKNN